MSDGQPSMPTCPGVVVRDSLSLTVLSVAEERRTTMPELEPSAYVGVAANDATHPVRRGSVATPTHVGAAANDTTYPRVRRTTLRIAEGLILYEEYHPFGTSSYRAADSSIEVSAKRYRYVGKERDEETGLDHMGARYYAPWLGRWTAADPIGLGDGVNRYAYVRGNPVGLVDPAGTKGVDPSTLEGAAAHRYIELVEESIEGSVQEFEVEPIQGDVLRAGAIDEQFARGGLLEEAHAGQARSPQENFERAANDPGRVRDFHQFGQDIAEARDELGDEVARGTAELVGEQVSRPYRIGKAVLRELEELGTAEHKEIRDPETGEVVGTLDREAYALVPRTEPAEGVSPEQFEAALKADIAQQAAEDFETLTSHGNFFKPDPGAQGPHVVFRRNRSSDVTQEPVGLRTTRPSIRRGLRGETNGSVALVSPTEGSLLPLVVEPKPGHPGGRPVRARPARPDETPSGF